MYEFHGDKRFYFDMTKKVTESHIIPFIKKNIAISESTHVLEIGCGEAGVLQAFTDLGCRAFGIELEESRLEFAREFTKTELEKGQIHFLNKNIYDVDLEKDIGHKFDIIILKDVIEHIPEQEKFMPQLHRFLNPGGMVFFAFPPWCMPYGGHQQILPPKLASRMPYYHLLPKPLYRGMLKMFGVNNKSISTMMEIKDTGISIQRFKKICANSGFHIADQDYYLFNPIYQHKFGIKPRKQGKLIAGIPWLRDFFTMGIYFLVKA